MQSRVFFTILLSLTPLTCVSLAQQPAPIAVIQSPTQGESVKTKDQVIIKMLRPGTPIVAVRSMSKGSQWWIQGVAESRGSQIFEVAARFGNDKTPVGARFQLAVLVTADAKIASMLQPGKSLDRLPAGLQSIAVDEVMFGGNEPPKQAAALTAELVSPTPNSEAKRIQLVSLRLEDSSDELPRLVIRSAEKGASWWVQEPLKKSDDGELLNGVARLGNERTLVGSKFLLMLVRPENETSRELLKTGGILKELTGFQCSEPIALIAGREGKESQPAAAPIALTSN